MTQKVLQAVEGKGMKLSLVTDTGGVNDKSFNQSAWEGLQQLEKDHGFEASFKESTKDADYEPNLNSFVKAKTDLTWGAGFLLEGAIRKVAEANPEAKLGIVDFAWPDTPKNVAAVVFNEHEGSYLVGIIAGLSTKSNKIGFVGGIEGDLIKKFEVGFRAGVKAVNPEAAENLNIQYAASFNDAAKGKTLAATMYDQGIDIIYHASGGTGNGVFQEATERKKNGQDVWVIGVDKDQYDLGPDVALTSMIKRVDTAVIQITEMMLDGNFPGGTVTVLGLKEDGVGIAPTSDKHVSKEILDKVDQYKKDIIDGKIKVPATQADFDAQ